MYRADRDWMADNHLKLNEEKTQIIWLGTRQQLNKVTARALTLLNAAVKFSTTVKDLGVLLDSQLTMADHIAALSRSCFFYIRQLRSIRQSLTTDAMKTLVYAFEQRPRWCQWSTATEAEISPECSSTGPK